ncbi:MAG: GspH/FimT family pseudopilin [Thiohalobacterales bacterium]
MNGIHHERGFTLPELLVSLAVVSILTVGTGNMLARFIQENRMAAEVNTFVTTLHVARSEAVKRNGRVVLCPSRDGKTCGNSMDWNTGWLLFRSNDRERNRDEALLQSGNPLQPAITMHSSNQRKRIVYQQDGSAGGTNSSFTFCDRRGLAKPRVICLSNTGRPRLSLTRCNGKPVDCA